MKTRGMGVRAAAIRTRCLQSTDYEERIILKSQYIPFELDFKSHRGDGFIA